MKAESLVLSDVISHTSHGSIVPLGVGSFKCVCVCLMYMKVQAHHCGRVGVCEAGVKDKQFRETAA